MEFRTAYAVTNGIRLHYAEHGPGPGSGAPLVVLCHGFPEFWWSWRHQLRALGEAGYRTVAVDLRGYNLSDKPAEGYDVMTLMADLAGLVDALGHDRAVMVGHDWGGLLTWPFALYHPDRLAGVIGVNTPLLPRTPVPPVQLLRQISPDQPIYIVQFQERGIAEEIVHRDVDAWMDLMLRGFVTVNTDAFPDDVVRRFADVFRPHGAIAAPIEYYRHMDRNWELTADTADSRVTVPALMISAANDPILHPGLTAGMEDRCDDLAKVVIPDCGHWTQQERPEETNAHILRFLGRLDPWG